LLQRESQPLDFRQPRSAGRTQQRAQRLKPVGADGQSDGGLEVRAFPVALLCRCPRGHLHRPHRSLLLRGSTLLRRLFCPDRCPRPTIFCLALLFAGGEHGLQRLTGALKPLDHGPQSGLQRFRLDSVPAALANAVQLHQQRVSLRANLGCPRFAFPQIGPVQPQSSVVGLTPKDAVNELIAAAQLLLIMAQHHRTPGSFGSLGHQRNDVVLQPRLRTLAAAAFAQRRAERADRNIVIPKVKSLALLLVLLLLVRLLLLLAIPAGDRCERFNLREAGLARTTEVLQRVRTKLVAESLAKLLDVGRMTVSLRRLVIALQDNVVQQVAEDRIQRESVGRSSNQCLTFAAGARIDADQPAVGDHLHQERQQVTHSVRGALVPRSSGLLLVGRGRGKQLVEHLRLVLLAQCPPRFQQHLSRTGAQSRLERVSQQRGPVDAQVRLQLSVRLLEVALDDAE
jgi:hypothetical protein